MVLGRGFLGPQICGPRGTDLCGTGCFAGWAETGYAGLHRPAFFSLFLILPEKNERESEKKAILVTFSPENIRSSGDDDSSSGDDDPSSGYDDSSSGGVLICFLFLSGLGKIPEPDYPNRTRSV